METQNLVISFDYSWFLAKNFAYAKCSIMKFHYRNSSTVEGIEVEVVKSAIFELQNVIQLSRKLRFWLFLLKNKYI